MLKEHQKKYKLRMIQSGRVHVNLSLGHIPECPSLGTQQVSGRGFRGVGIQPGAHHLLLTVWADFLISWQLQEYRLLLKFSKGIMKLNLKIAWFSPSGKTLNHFASWVSIFCFFSLGTFLPTSRFHKKNFCPRNWKGNRSYWLEDKASWKPFDILI